MPKQMKNSWNVKQSIESQALKITPGNSFLTQLLVLRFIKKLRQSSNNVNIHSIKQEHLTYINDPTMIKTSYAYHGNGLRQLIKLHSKKGSNYLRKLFKYIYNFGKQQIERMRILSLIHPNWILGLDIMISMISVEQFFLIALSIAFGFELNIWIDVISYMFIIIDILIKYCLGTYDKTTIIHNTQQNFNWELIFNIISLIPQILYWVIQNQSINYARLCFFYRVISINKVFGRIEYQLSDFKQNFLQLFKLYCTLISVAHLIGCFWYILGQTESNSWIHQYFDNFYNITSEPHDKLGIDNTTLYITSLYWSITTMLTVGYGDVLPVNQQEKLYAIFTMLIGCCLFGYIMNSIGNIFDQINKNDKILRQEMQKLNNFLDSKNIDDKLKSKFRKYLEHYHIKQQSHRLIGRNNISNISDELIIEFNGQILKHLSKNNFVLNRFQQAVIQVLSKQLEEHNFLPDELIFERQSPIFKLYMILDGIVLEQFQRNTPEPVQMYKNGDCFGEIDFISGERKQCFFISQTFSNTYSLERESFINIVRETNYQDYEKICMVKDQLQLSNDLRGFQKVCPACFKKDHQLYSCPQIHFYPSINKIIFQKYQQARLNNFIRKPFKGKNALQFLEMVQQEAVVFLDDNNSLIDFKSDDGLSQKSSDKIFTLSEIFKSDDEFIDNQEDDSPLNSIPMIDTLNYKRKGKVHRSIFESHDIKDKVQSNLNQTILNQYRAQREQKINNSKFATQQQIQVKELFFLNDFDRMQHFSEYFPNFNFSTVLKEL